MNTIDRVDLSRIRAAAAAKHRASKVHAEADRIERGWSDDSARDWSRLIGLLAAIGLACVIGYGAWQRFIGDARRVVDDAYTREIVAECRNEGGAPHVDRDREGKAIAARCERGKP